MRVSVCFLPQSSGRCLQFAVNVVTGDSCAHFFVTPPSPPFVFRCIDTPDTFESITYIKPTANILLLGDPLHVKRVILVFAGSSTPGLHRPEAFRSEPMTLSTCMTILIPAQLLSDCASPSPDAFGEQPSQFHSISLCLGPLTIPRDTPFIVNNPYPPPCRRTQTTTSRDRAVRTTPTPLHHLIRHNQMLTTTRQTTAGQDRLTSTRTAPAAHHHRLMDSCHRLQWVMRTASGLVR